MKAHRNPADVVWLGPLQTQALGIAAAAVGTSLVAGNWTEVAPAPFVWRDVALVCLLSALPLAALATGAIAPRLRPGSCLLVAGGLLAVGVLLLLSPESLPPASGPWMRITIALSLPIGVLLLWSGPSLGKPVKQWPASDRANLAAWVVALIVAVAFPWLYLRGRCEHDAGRLTELVEQSRLGEASQLAQRMAALDPSRNWLGQPISRARAQLAAAVEQLEAQVRSPLPAAAPLAEQIARARDLAILGRPADALDVLQSAPEAGSSPEACLLQGTILETQGRWQAGEAAYARARDLVEDLPLDNVPLDNVPLDNVPLDNVPLDNVPLDNVPLDERQAALQRAHTGIAYCRRKQGQYAQAEEAYLQLLALSPDADTHFLLAQFYEDAQHARFAQSHARQAMALAPERYGQRGQKLIDKLVTLHFGCWGVYRAESHLPSPAGEIE